MIQVDWDEYFGTDRPTKKAKPKAFCSSIQCFTTDCRKTSPGIVKEVSINKDFCPSCGAALWWGSPDELKAERIAAAWKGRNEIQSG